MSHISHVRRISRIASAEGKRLFSSRANSAVIVAANRTPIGSINGSLAPMPGVHLAAAAIRDVMKRARVDPSQVDEAILGNVVTANEGQAPATQAIIHAGFPWSTPATQVNKVCASGMKAVMFASQTIMAGQNKCVLAGGFESMSNVPFYLPNARLGYGLGHGQVLDGIIKDGLWDAFDNQHMGSCAEVCAAEYKIPRSAQDEYALESYRRATAAWKNGDFADEIVSVEVKDRRGNATTVSEDEEYKRVSKEKLLALRPAFKRENGTVTAASSSKLNDGAAMILLTSEEYANQNNLKPLARVIGFADAARRSVEFTVAPALAIPKALKMAGIDIEQVDFFEINEAFAVVALANQQILNIPSEKLNVFGGAVALGHPIGASGARIITTLLNVLKRRNGKIGCAAICNGGGGASAIVVERL